MPIVDGEPADDRDVWFRILTDEGYIKKGKIHPSAFKGKNVIAPPKKPRAWDREMSGRLRSLTRDLTAEAEAYCKEISRQTGQTKTFSGVMFCHVREAWANFEAVQTGIHYTPKQTDNAHADLTFVGLSNAPEDKMDRLRLWLCNAVDGLHPAQVARLMPTAGCEHHEYCQRNN
jgi:hypothetical protein